MKTKHLLIAASAFLSAGQSLASGLYLYEIGTEDVGLAAAGMAARAQDASTIASNPAGMTRLSGTQSTMGVQALYGDVSYTQDGKGTMQGSDPGNVIGWFPGLSSFLSYSVDDKLKVGFAMYGNFGLGLHFGDWAGKQLIKDTSLIALTMQPSAAYKLNENWSIGAGLGINYGLFSLKRDALSGEEKSKDSDWAFNGKLGVMYEPTQSTRFGLAYTSATKFNFDTQANVTLSYTINNPIPGRPGITLTKEFTLPLEGMVNTPQQLMFSGFHQINPTWAIMGNLGWQDWSAYSDSTIWAANRVVPSKERLNDTWHAALGVQHQLSGALRLNAGVAYDSSFYKDQNNTSLTMPSGDSWRFGLGGQYQLDKKNSIGLAFETVQVESAHVPSTLLSGDYKNPALYFLSVNYSMQF